MEIRTAGSDPRRFLYIQTQMVFNRCFDFPLLDADIPLCNSCTAMLQKVLHQGDIVPIVPVNLRCVVLAETVGTNARNVQIITNDFKLSLY